MAGCIARPRHWFGTVPRIRSIKPEFWEDEKVGAVSRDARLLFICTWNLADDFGNLRAAPRFLRLQAFPYDDDLTDADVGRMLNQLSRRGLVRLYEVRGEHYASVTNLDRHQYQKPGRKKVAKCPDLSDCESKEIKQLQGFVPDKNGQDRAMPALPLPRSLPQSQPLPLVLSTSPEPKADGARAEFDELFAYYQQRTGKTRTQPLPDRFTSFKARRRRYSMGDLRLAVDGATIDPDYATPKGRDRPYHAWENIFCNDARVEKLRDAAMDSSGSGSCTPQPWLAHGMTEDAYRRNGPPMEKR